MRSSAVESFTMFSSIENRSQSNSSPKYLTARKSSVSSDRDVTVYKILKIDLFSVGLRTVVSH